MKSSGPQSPETESSGPGSMHAVRVPRHGGIEVLEWGPVPRPSPGPGEVAVEIRAAGLNHLDLWVRRGVPGHTFPLPMIPGSDGVGEIIECGPGADGLLIGETVIISPGVSCGHCEPCLSGRDPLCRDYGILGETRDGTCAERIVVPARNLIPMPANVEIHHAAAFALAALTAWTMLVERARLQTGESVLILAGGSGVGSFGIQIARLLGCRVIATAGGPDKWRKVAELGADEVIDHDGEDLARRVKTLTDGRGVDVVFEHVGEATWSASLRSLTWGGRLVTCGATTGPRVESDLRLIFFKSLSILGSTMGSKGTVPRLVRFLAEGKLRPVIGDVLPMSEVAEAHRRLETREIFGKVVLTRE